jgi:hypothetical protein
VSSPVRRCLQGDEQPWALCSKDVAPRRGAGFLHSFESQRFSLGYDVAPRRGAWHLLSQPRMWPRFGEHLLSYPKGVLHHSTGRMPGDLNSKKDPLPEALALRCISEGSHSLPCTKTQFSYSGTFALGAPYLLPPTSACFCCSRPRPDFSTKQGFPVKGSCSVQYMSVE